MRSRGKAILAGWDRACERDRFRWLTAAVAAGLFFLLASGLTVMTYMTIDEVSFMQAIAQVPEKGLAALHNTLAHSSQENASSISLWLCALIGQFYRLDPDGYWYLGYHLLMLWASLTVLGRCVLVKTSRRGMPAWMGVLLTLLLGGGLFLYAYARLAFTVTAAAVGSAAVALVLCRGDETTRAGRVRSDILAGLLTLLCFLQRRATGMAVACFLALAVVYALVRIWLTGDPGRGRAMLALCLAVLVTAGVTAGLCVSGDKLESDENYREAEYYRSLIGDILFDKLTIEQYERAGAPKELATLMQGWFFMDERVTTDMLRDLADIYYADLAAQPKASLPARLWETAKDLAATLWSNGQMRAQSGLILALILLCLAQWAAHGRAYWPEGLCALCAAGGALLMLLHLAADGRFLIRVFLVVSYPAAVTLVLLALSAPAPEAKGAKAGTFILTLAGAALCIYSVTTVPHVLDGASRAEVFSEQTAIETYEAAHPDKTLITSIYDARGSIADPLHPLDAYSPNRVIWGYIGDLAKSDEDRLYAGAFFRDDVLFMSDRFSSLAGLLQYMTVGYGPVQATLDAQLTPAVTVTDIDAVSPGEHYTGWYEQNGITYYFRDGQALTGEQTIDGKTYTFAPAGAAARFMPISSENGTVVYTTNAYSLMDN